MADSRSDNRTTSGDDSALRTKRRNILGGAAALGLAGLFGGTRSARGAKQDPRGHPTNTTQFARAERSEN